MVDFPQKHKGPFTGGGLRNESKRKGRCKNRGRRNRDFRGPQNKTKPNIYHTIAAPSQSNIQAELVKP